MRERVETRLSGPQSCGDSMNEAITHELRPGEQREESKPVLPVLSVLRNGARLARR